MDTMPAWRVEAQGAPREVLKLCEIPVPEPGPGFLRMELEAAGLGLPDALMCRGTYPLTPGGAFTPGQEIVGRVTAVGEGVDPAKIGTRCMGVTGFYLGHGGFAREVLAADATMFPAPEWLGAADAAAFHIPFQTGWNALHDRAALQNGETLVVLGAAGGSGAAAVQLGKLRGARVIAVAGGAEKGAYCRQIGADTVIDHRGEDVAERIREETGGHGADIIFDPVGGAFAESLAGAIASEGRFLLVGFAGGRWAQFDPARVVQGNFSVMGVYAGAYGRDHTADAYGAMLPDMKEGQLASLVTREFAFEDLPVALHGLDAREVIGKWVLRAPEN